MVGSQQFFANGEGATVRLLGFHMHPERFPAIADGIEAGSHLQVIRTKLLLGGCQEFLGDR